MVVNNTGLPIKAFIRLSNTPGHLQHLGSIFLGDAGRGDEVGDDEES